MSKNIQEEMLKTLAIDNYPNPTVVDLGAGSGTFLEKILMKNASATCYCFINVDVFLKHHLWCAIGGQKTL